MNRIEAKGKFFFLGDKKFYLQGVTYGPFRPRNKESSCLGTEEETRRDFALMHLAGINVVRVYHTPPGWFLDLAETYSLYVIITIPWHERTLFLDSTNTIREIESKVEEAASANAGHQALFGFYVDNEIPSDLVRWYGGAKMARFLDGLVSIIKNKDSEALVAYSNFPPTEYLLPQSVDFYSYNVYLHRRAEFRSYLSRLQHLSDERPLVLGEFGMDTIRHSQDEQAKLIEGHYEEVFRGGLAGTILFSWTDEWFTNGVDVDDWAFGLVDKERVPKKSYEVVKNKTISSTEGETVAQSYPLAVYPKVSIVVCSYNGGKTLRLCLDSLLELNYPDYEILLIDDGSTDHTPSIAKDYPTVRYKRQKNFGLSVARNAGATLSEGEIVAYTDSDCMPDKDWLYHLIKFMVENHYAVVGGPNISPPANSWIQAAVASAPGAPSHVMMDDQIAEHVPGCNIAFYKSVLEAIGGFDPDYRKAGDDVDVCWRIMQAGYEIGFSPAAVVWHYRRFTVKDYFKQQKGYGEAEALLRFKHINYFDDIGGISWHGVIYGKFRSSRFFHAPLIYHGVFGSGLFQSIYTKPYHFWLYLPLSLEWNLISALLLLLSFFWNPLKIVPLITIGCTLWCVIEFVIKTNIEAKHDSIRARLLLAYLGWLQPIVRGWARYFTWVSKKQTPKSVLMSEESHRHQKVSLTESGHMTFWSEGDQDRLALLGQIVCYLEEEGWKYAIDNGWTKWDINIFANRWWHVRLRTLTEIYPQGKRLNRIEIGLRPTTFSALLAILMALVGMVSWLKFPLLCLGVGVSLFLVLLVLYYKGLLLRKRLGELVQAAAFNKGMSILDT
ncbi:MAG: glycosyltransferase [Verrucomicrobiota bacterium]